MLTVTLKNQTYQIEKLSTMEQFHVARRLGPILAVMGITVDTVRKGFDFDLEDMKASLGPVSQIVAYMTKDDSEEIIFGCLVAVKRKQSTGLAPVCNDKRQLMFDDIDMAVMLRLVIAVIKYNLQNFMLGLIDGEGSTSS